MLTKLAESWVLDIHMARCLQVNDVAFVFGLLVLIRLDFGELDYFRRAGLHGCVVLLGDTLKSG